jgi:hypothetical protein
MDEQRAGLSIACTLDTGQGRERAERWKRLLDRARISALHQSDEVVLAFQPTAHTRAELSELIELERLCCSFLAWDLTETTDMLVLRISAAASVAPEDVVGELRTLAKDLGACPKSQASS